MTRSLQISNSELEHFNIQPETNKNPIHLLRGLYISPRLLPLTTLLEGITVSRLPKVVLGLWYRNAAPLEELGFRYPVEAELDPWEEPFEGVEIYGPFGKLYLSQKAFELLMLRVLQAILDTARSYQTSLLTNPFWPEFQDTLHKLELRAKLENKE